MAKVKFIW